jgi:hypothetical protein
MKNFLYNKSDLFVALVIIVVAVLLIYTRVDAIMGGAAGQELKGTETLPVPIEPAGSDADADSADADSTGDAAAAPPEGSADTPDPNAPTDAQGDGTGDVPDDATEPPEEEGTDEPADTEPVLFTVEVGANTSTIAKNLAAAGLVKSSDAFLKEVTKQKAETKMKAGTFKIKPGSSVSKIVKTLTN